MTVASLPARLPPVTFHALRHTAATLLLSEGEHPRVVQELLGHAQVSITLDRYGHMTAQADEQRRRGDGPVAG